LIKELTENESQKKISEFLDSKVHCFSKDDEWMTAMDKFGQLKASEKPVKAVEEKKKVIVSTGLAPSR
jgi:hypothetical protein